MIGNVLTQERVKHLFDYNPETGLLTRLVTVAPRGKAGAIVGSHIGRYLCMSIDYKFYRVHRVIWLWVYGEFPKDHIDHINHDGKDNRISNLREATSQENQRNRSIPSNNTSGVMGVYRLKRVGKWQAQIKVNMKQIHLGHFEIFADAVAARKVAEIKYGFHRNHGNPLPPYSRGDYE